MNEPLNDSQAEIHRLQVENKELRESLARLETGRKVRVASPLDWEADKKQADQLLVNLRSQPLTSRLLKSTGGHVALVLLTSISFLFFRSSTDADPEEIPTPEATGVSETIAEPTSAASTPQATQTTTEPITAQQKMEESLNSTSDERPNSSEINLFDSDFDLDL